MFILASSSPRRKELLSLLIKDFTIIVPDIDERLLNPAVSPKDLALEESRLKAYKIFSTHHNDEVLACDTIVLLGENLLEKPTDEEDAVKMLMLEQGKRQTVISAYTYLSPSKEITRSVVSHVYFNPLTEEEIRTYVKKYLPLDKAGAYGIQDDFPLIDRIEGSFYNVMGLPVEDLKAHLPL